MSLFLIKSGSDAWSLKFVKIHFHSLLSGRAIASDLTSGGFIGLSFSIGWRLFLAYALGKHIFLTRVIRWSLRLSRSIDRRLCFTCTVRRCTLLSLEIGQRLLSHSYDFLHRHPQPTKINIPVGPQILIDPPPKDSLLGRLIIPISLPSIRIYAQFKQSLPYSQLGLINLFPLHEIALQSQLPWEGGDKVVVSCVKGCLTRKLNIMLLSSM